MWMWMMLPGAALAAFRHAHASDSVRAILLFVGSYLAVWTFVVTALYNSVRDPSESLINSARHFS
jgi:purine-cytosine permease-like protein